MAMDVTLRQLRAYVAVLEAASFSEAAKAMHLSQAALSGLIKELENRRRRPPARPHHPQRFPLRRRRSLRADGAARARQPRRSAGERDQPQGAAPRTGAGGGPRDVVLHAAAGADRRLQRRHPGVDVRFDDVPIQQVLAGLQNGSTDIGFGPAGVMADDARVETHMICADPLWVALRPDDPLARGQSVSWKDLRDRPLINYMPNIAINVLSHVPPRHHPRKWCRCTGSTPLCRCCG